jgi:hypothetical protein
MSAESAAMTSLIAVMASRSRQRAQTVPDWHGLGQRSGATCWRLTVLILGDACFVPRPTVELRLVRGLVVVLAQASPGCSSPESHYGHRQRVHGPPVKRLVTQIRVVRRRVTRLLQTPATQKFARRRVVRAIAPLPKLAWGPLPRLAQPIALLSSGIRCPNGNLLYRAVSTGTARLAGRWVEYAPLTWCGTP